MFVRVGGSWISFGNSEQQVRLKKIVAESDAYKFYTIFGQKIIF